MTEERILLETSRCFGQGMQYDYSLNDQFRPSLERHEETPSGLKAKTEIEAYRDLFEELSRQPPKTLELASTIVAFRQGGCDWDKAIEDACEFKNERADSPRLTLARQLAEKVYPGAMRKTEKIFRDPLYNYVSIDRESDGWLLDLLDCPEVQRLRRIRQLGVSDFTYPGADHSRLSHTLGVLHLMQQALEHIEKLGHKEANVTRARHPLLAAALLHDVGHGPFSHLFEVPLGIDHESWSKRIICSEETKVNEILKRSDIEPNVVADPIEDKNHARPPWQKCLLSSELDVDRLDYLRRDSLFTGSGYGHFDWYRILHTFDLHDTTDGSRVLVAGQGEIRRRGVHLLAFLHVQQRLPTQDDEGALRSCCTPLGNVRNG